MSLIALFSMALLIAVGCVNFSTFLVLGYTGSLSAVELTFIAFVACAAFAPLMPLATMLLIRFTSFSLRYWQAAFLSITTGLIGSVGTLLTAVFAAGGFSMTLRVRTDHRNYQFLVATGEPTPSAAYSTCWLLFDDLPFGCRDLVADECRGVGDVCNINRRNAPFLSRQRWGQRGNLPANRSAWPFDLYNEAGFQRRRCLVFSQCFVRKSWKRIELLQLEPTRNAFRAVGNTAVWRLSVRLHAATRFPAHRPPGQDLTERFQPFAFAGSEI